MLDITSFDAVFGYLKRPFPASLVSEIRSMQQKLGGKLFFHRLLEQLQIKRFSLVQSSRLMMRYRGLQVGRQFVQPCADACERIA